jgi:hypothetical protein
MKKRESWMRKGVCVLANNKFGRIVSFESNVIDGVEYVYYITVHVNGYGDGRYHPNDIVFVS